jgi:hypothetical protein
MKGTIELGRCCGGFCAQYREKGRTRDLETYEPNNVEWDEHNRLRDLGQDGEADKRKLQWWLKALKKALERWVRWGWLTEAEAEAQIKSFMDAHPELEEPVEVSREFEEIRKRALVPAERE